MWAAALGAFLGRRDTLEGRGAGGALVVAGSAEGASTVSSGAEGASVVPGESDVASLSMATDAEALGPTGS